VSAAPDAAAAACEEAARNKRTDEAEAALLQAEVNRLSAALEVKSKERRDLEAALAVVSKEAGCLCRAWVAKGKELADMKAYPARRARLKAEAAAVAKKVAAEEEEAEAVAAAAAAAAAHLEGARAGTTRGRKDGDEGDGGGKARRVIPPVHVGEPVAAGAPVNDVDDLEEDEDLHAPVNDVDESGRTLLHHAALKGQAGPVGTLLGAGAALNATDEDGWTPLHHAAWKGHKAVVAGAYTHPLHSSA